MQSNLNLPTLSVFVPNYNHARYLPECVNSLVNQSIRPLEIVVIDDCSTDNSIAVLEEISRKEPRVSFVRNEKNMGVLRTLNRALEMAKGEYIFLPGADDRVIPGHFEKSMTELAKHPEAGLCFSDPASFDHETGKVSENRLRLSDSPSFFSGDELATMATRQHLHISGGCVFKTSALRSIGGYPLDLKWHSDYFVAFAIGFRYGAIYVPEPLTQWRATPQSYLTAGVRRWGEQWAVVKRLLDILLSDEYRDILPRYQKSGVLALAPRITPAILSRRKYWRFLNFTLLKRAVPADIFWMLPHSLQRVIRRARASMS